MTGKRRKEPTRPSLVPRRSGTRRRSPAAASADFPVQTFTPARKLTRRELRAERRRRRRRLGAAGIAGLSVLALVVAGLVVLGVRQVTGTGEAEGRTQTTMLLQIKGAAGNAVASALLAHDRKAGSGAEVLIPSRLIGDVCGYGSQPFGQILTLPQGDVLSRSTLADLMDVTVDGSWILDAAAFTRLVDRVGGVTADVDVDVVRPARGGGAEIVVPHGDGQRLDGARALAFATYVARGEDQAAGLARLQQVLDGLVAQLPRTADSAAATIRALGPGSAASLPPDRLAEVLTGFAAAAREDNATYTVLPVATIDVPGGQVSYRIDAAKTRDLVSSQLASSVPADARSEHNEVFVQNGVGTPGLVQSACAKLVRGGFSFAGSGNAASFGTARSAVLVFDTSAEALDVGYRVAAALGLPRASVQPSANAITVADVLVILGKDYKP